MKNQQLFLVVLFWSLAGLFILLLLSQYAQPRTISTREVLNNVGRQVIFKGRVIAVEEGKPSFITVQDDFGKLSVVLFEGSNWSSIKGKDIQVLGKVRVYHDDLEIIAEEVRVLDVKRDETKQDPHNKCS